MNFKPQDNVKIQFRIGDKNFKDDDTRSTLHITSVDNRVQMMGQHNEMSIERYFKAAGQFGIGKIENEVNGTIDDRYKILKNYNAYFLTNAYINEKYVDCSILPRSLSSDLSLDDNDNSNLEASSRVNDTDLTEIYERKNFPETWIFEDVKGEDIKNGLYELTEQVPDTIGKFMVNAFVFHPEHGIGIAEEKSFVVFQEFYVEAYLPYSVYVGEILNVQVKVFNYLKSSKGKSVNAKLTMELLPDEEDQEIANFVRLKKTQQGTCEIEIVSSEPQTKNLNVPHDIGAVHTFTLQVNKGGNMKIKVTARAGKIGDSIEKILLVERNGIRQVSSEPFFVDLRNNTQEKKSNYQFDYRFPPDVNKESISVHSTVYGNLLGQVLMDADKLVVVPYGNYLEKLMNFSSILIS